jgi:hypothetical protein
MNFSSANIPAVSLVITAQICRSAATKEIKQPVVRPIPMPFPAAQGNRRVGKLRP